MKKTLVIAFIAFAFVACKKDIVKGSGNIITEDRNAGSFSAISTFGSAKIYISAAPDITVKVKGYQNLVSNYKTEVNGNTLELRYRDNLNVQNDILVA